MLLSQDPSVPRGPKQCYRQCWIVGDRAVDIGCIGRVDHLERACRAAPGRGADILAVRLHRAGCRERRRAHAHRSRRIGGLRTPILRHQLVDVARERALIASTGPLEQRHHDARLQDRRPRELELRGRPRQRYDRSRACKRFRGQRLHSPCERRSTTIRDQEYQDRAHRIPQRLGAHQSSRLTALETAREAQAIRSLCGSPFTVFDPAQCEDLPRDLQWMRTSRNMTASL